jgi:hypothetical protein
VSLNERAVLIYSPIVAGIPESSSPDIQLIESTLSGLLDFAGSEEGLRLPQAGAREQACHLENGIKSMDEPI